jgi:hypothetical protein
MAMLGSNQSAAFGLKGEKERRLPLRFLPNPFEKECDKSREFEGSALNGI